jgi:outer membrane lipoprotein-sorting protein
MGYKKKYCRKYLGLLLIVTSFFMLGWADSFEAIRAAAGKVTTIQADFIQEKHMAILARPVTAEGHFAYKAPGSLRWEYTKPVRSLLLMHEGEAHRYSQTEKGLTEDAAAVQYMDFVLEEISKWLNGRFDETAMFEASLVSGKVVMTPKDEGMTQFIKRIEMVPADQPGVIKEVTIYDDEDSYTRFIFVDPKINVPLSDELFRAAK